MAKVITLSRRFPAYHPRKGEQTEFAEKVLKSINPNITYWPFKCEHCGFMGMSSCCAGGWQIADTGDYDDPLCPKCFSRDLDGELGSLEYMDRYYLQDITCAKHHTIRGGTRWKTGDMASLRLWSDRPYNSPQILLAPDVKIAVTPIKIDTAGRIFIDNKPAPAPLLPALALNDGLSEDDLKEWFKPAYKKADFIGQIICWNPSITYTGKPQEGQGV